VTLDPVGHGARRYPDFAERFEGDRGERSFFEIVEQSAGELPAVVDALARLGWSRPGRLGTCGISMGGFILFGLFGAVGARCPIDAVATLIASPRWRHVSPSPHERPERYFPTPLLMLTGGADLTAAPDDARALHEDLRPRYAAAPERLRYVEYPGEGHMFSEAAWHQAWDEVLTWFARFLRS
jgi:dienelactone hydrolase